MIATQVSFNPGDSNRSPYASLVVIIGIGVVVATLANGATTYLKRVGLLETQSYEHYFSEHCVTVRHAPGGNCCLPRSGNLGSTTLEEKRGARAASSHLFRSTGGELLLKLAKDALVLAFIALSLYIMMRGGGLSVTVTSCPPLLILALAVSFGFLTSLWREGSATAIAGLRSHVFLAVALVASWSVPGMPLIAKWVVVSLACQIVFLPYEWLRGMPLRFCPESMRVAGTLVLPNSLGVFAVTTSAFCLAFLRGRATHAMLLAVALLLVIASGSGTGLVALLVVALLYALEGSTDRRRVLIAAAALVSFALLIPALPFLTRRADLFTSVLGANARFDNLIEVWRSADVAEIAFGRGLGHGANVLKNLGLSIERPTDSAVVAILVELGLFGVASFYALLTWGMLRHVALRPFFVATAVCSLFLNIIELFPLNFLLGLALAASMAPLASQQAR